MDKAENILVVKTLSGAAQICIWPKDNLKIEDVVELSQGGHYICCCKRQNYIYLCI